MNWLNKQTVITGSAGIILLFGILATFADQPILQLTGLRSETKQPPSSQATGSAVPETNYKIGDQIKLEGRLPIVHRIATYTSSIHSWQPANPFKYVSFDLTLTNTSLEPVAYNALEFRLLDRNGREYTSIITDQQPQITSGLVRPEQTIRGFLTFELPQAETPAKLLYQPGVVIDLTQ